MYDDVKSTTSLNSFRKGLKALPIGGAVPLDADLEYMDCIYHFLTHDILVVELVAVYSLSLWQRLNAIKVGFDWIELRLQDSAERL